MSATPPLIFVFGTYKTLAEYSIEYDLRAATNHLVFVDYENGNFLEPLTAFYRSRKDPHEPRYQVLYSTDEVSFAVKSRVVATLMAAKVEYDEVLLNTTQELRRYLYQSQRDKKRNLVLLSTLFFLKNDESGNVWNKDKIAMELVASNKKMLEVSFFYDSSKAELGGEGLSYGQDFDTIVDLLLMTLTTAAPASGAPVAHTIKNSWFVNTSRLDSLKFGEFYLRNPLLFEAVYSGNNATAQ
jgi:hypothetical protein